MRPPFADRDAAGAELAERVRALALPAPTVLALPRGGVPVAAPIARALAAPLGLLFVRKIGVPWQRELAVGAVAGPDGDEIVIDERLRRELRIEPAEIEHEAARQREEIRRQRRLYLGERASAPVTARDVVVVDDGIATGTTMRAALQALRRLQPRQLVVAVPVASREAFELLAGEVDALVCLATPEPFRAVGLHYVDFGEVGDDDVRALLAGR